MRVAASIRGWSSGSSAPRSTASISSRESSKYERSSTRGSTCLREASTSAGGAGLLEGDQRAAREEVLLQVRVHLGVAPPIPFEQHGEVLLLLVPVVRQDPFQSFVGRGVDALVVPVGGFQLFLHRSERPVV